MNYFVTTVSLLFYLPGQFNMAASAIVPEGTLIVQPEGDEGLWLPDLSRVRTVTDPAYLRPASPLELLAREAA